jgi:hypothetical protein
LGEQGVDALFDVAWSLAVYNRKEKETNDKKYKCETEGSECHKKISRKGAKKNSSL